MPCRDGCNSVTYVCRCKKCAKRREKTQAWWDRNAKRKVRLMPEYLKKARAVLGAHDGPLIFISDEAGRLEMEVFGEYGNWPAELGSWLDRCSPFPEDMTFEKMSIKNATVLYTTHKHTDVPDPDECKNCPACRD